MTRARNHGVAPARLIVLVLVLALAASALWALSAVRPPAEAGVAPGQPGDRPPANLTFELLDGRRLTLGDLRGQAVLLNVWASWCPQCRAELPAIESIYQDYGPRGLAVVAVNATYQDDPAQAVALPRALGLTLPVAFDRAGQVDTALRLRGFPSTYFIDRQGIIRAAVVGAAPSETSLRARVEALLAESR